MALFCAAIRRDPVSRLSFSFLSLVQVFSCEISSVYRLKYLYNHFYSHFCFQVIVVLLILMLSEFFLVVMISLSLLFLCSIQVIVAVNRYYLQCWWLLFLLLLLTHIVYVIWLKKKLDGNYTRMLRAILNKSRWQHPTRHQLYDHLPPTTKTIQVRRARHAGHCWRSKDELISDVLLWTPAYGQAKAGRPART